MRERRLARTDGVPDSPDATALERADIQKRLYKTNETFRRQAVRNDAPAHAKLAIQGSKLTRSVNKRRTQK
jgi:hypothetical protein